MVKPTTDTALQDPHVRPVYIEGGKIADGAVVYNVHKTINATTWDSRDDFPQDIDVSGYRELMIFFYVITITGGTSPTATLICDSIIPAVAAANGQYVYDLVDTGAQAAGYTGVKHVGAGTTLNVGCGVAIRLAMVTAGSPTSVEFGICVIGK